MPKGAKEPRGFSVSHLKGDSKPILKGAKEPRGFSINHLQRGIRTLCQISAELPGKLVQREKVEFYYFKGKSAEHLDQTGIELKRGQGNKPVISQTQRVRSNL
jgi:hypothetical protein